MNDLETQAKMKPEPSTEETGVEYAERVRKRIRLLRDEGLSSEDILADIDTPHRAFSVTAEGTFHAQSENEVIQKLGLERYSFYTVGENEESS